MNQIYTESHENDAVNIACNISSEDAIVLVELDKAFTLFQSKATLWFAVYKDYLDLQGYLDTLLENHYSSLRLLNDPEVLSSISRYVSNFLSSSSIMLTILEQDFPSSESKNDWNLKRRDLHKNNIEYQFCYELRNYSQHYNLPINTIGKLYDENSIPYIFIGFYLPNKDNKVCRKIDRILLSMDKSINVSHYIKRYMEILSTLFVDYMNHSKSIMTNCDNHLIRIMTKYNLGQLSSFMVCNRVHDGSYEDIVNKSTCLNVSSFYWVKRQLETARNMAT